MHGRIPNIFHFVFGLVRQVEPFHLVHYLCLESCLQVNRPERLYFHYRYEPYGRYWDHIKDRLTLVKVDLPRAIQKFRYSDRGVARYRHAHLADFVRLEPLIAMGGVYADIDTIFVNPIPPSLFAHDFVLGEEADVYCERTQRTLPSLCNAFIMSAPGAAFGRVWLDQMTRRFDGSWSGHSCLLAKELSLTDPSRLHVEPSRTFYKHMWTPDGLRTLLEQCDRDVEGVVSMHLWSHLWWEKRRTDFSPVHAGLITPAHVREADTTYTIAARPFLPENAPLGRAGSFAGLFHRGRRD